MLEHYMEFNEIPIKSNPIDHFVILLNCFTIFPTPTHMYKRGK